MLHRLLYLVLSSILILLIQSRDLSAQYSEMDIKISGDFYWGEGFGESRETAVNNAKRDLIEKLIVRVESDATLTESESNNDYSADFESTTNTMSRMELRGLEYLPPNERPNGTWEVIAFVSKSDFEESLSIEEERLLLGLEQALEAEENGRLNVAIPQYFDILASTYFFPTPFFTNVEQHGIEAELQGFIRGKINSWINDLEFELDKVRSLSTANNTEFYFDVITTYNGNKTSNLTITFNRPGYAKHPIRDGEVEIFSDIPPDEIVEGYVFSIEPIIPENLDDDKVSILEEILPVRELTLEIDFSDVIEIDFVIEKVDDKTYTFIPNIENLSVFDLEWDFGDGNTSSTSSPTHTYNSDASSQLVTLIINQSDELAVTKPISGGTRNQVTEERTITSDEDNVEETNDIIEAFVIPFSQTSYVNEAIRMKDGQNLTSYLNRLRLQDVIMLGRSSDVDDINESYLAVINPDNRSVVALLTPVKNGFRTNLSNNSAVDNSKLSETFRGYGSVWFQFK